jgi:hypothetical protein
MREQVIQVVEQYRNWQFEFPPLIERTVQPNAVARQGCWNRSQRNESLVPRCATGYAVPRRTKPNMRISWRRGATTRSEGPPPFGGVE